MVPHPPRWGPHDWERHDACQVFCATFCFSGLCEPLCVLLRIPLVPYSRAGNVAPPGPPLLPLVCVDSRPDAVWSITPEHRRNPSGHFPLRNILPHPHCTLRIRPFALLFFVRHQPTKYGCTRSSGARALRPMRLTVIRRTQAVSSIGMDQAVRVER